MIFDSLFELGFKIIVVFGEVNVIVAATFEKVASADRRKSGRHVFEKFDRGGGLGDLAKAERDDGAVEMLGVTG